MKLFLILNLQKTGLSLLGTFLMIIKTFVTFIQGDHNNWLIQTDK